VVKVKLAGQLGHVNAFLLLKKAPDRMSWCLAGEFSGNKACVVSLAGVVCVSGATPEWAPGGAGPAGLVQVQLLALTCGSLQMVNAACPAEISDLHWSPFAGGEEDRGSAGRGLVHAGALALFGRETALRAQCLLGGGSGQGWAGG